MLDSLLKILLDFLLKILSGAILFLVGQLILLEIIDREIKKIEK
jgi:hypothetical protein